MKLNTKNCTDFFNDEYVNWASYDNLRKIGSVIDGQKNAARKILWFTQQKNLTNEIKVSQLDSKVAEWTEYLHGSMAGVIVNLGQDYTGTNNINLMLPEGNFGTRLVPEASAARYIYTYGSKDFFNLFNKQDTDILEHQTFEGHRIEPKFMLPSLPMLLVNGSEGVSSGFAQKILPRNPEEIKKYLKYRLTHHDAPAKPFKNKPWYKNFKGTIQQGENPKQWIITGSFTKTTNKVIITELPIGYNLKSYKKVLDKLELDKKIKSYTDFSDKHFKFEIDFARSDLKALTDEKIINLLKLQKKITENYTIMSEFNTVQVKEHVKELMEDYYNTKIKYLIKRKNNSIKILTENIKLDVSKYVFIKSVIDEDIIITKRPTEDIIADIYKTDKIIKHSDSYDYLLNMNIRSLTQERADKLLNSIKASKKELDILKMQSSEEMWLEDLEQLS